MVEIPEGIFSSEDDTEKIVKELFSDKGLDFKTDLTHSQIVEICKLMHLSDKYRIRAIKPFVERFKTLKVSLNRQGRKEFIEALRQERELHKDKDLNTIDKMLR